MRLALLVVALLAGCAHQHPPAEAPHRAPPHREAGALAAEERAAERESESGRRDAARYAAAPDARAEDIDRLSELTAASNDTVGKMRAPGRGRHRREGVAGARRATRELRRYLNSLRDRR